MNTESPSWGQKNAPRIRSMKTNPITANATQLGIPINSRLPMTLPGGISLERLVRSVVGLPGFEPGSIAPKATSIDQTNPQAPRKSMRTTKRQELCWSQDHESTSCRSRIPSISACPIRCSQDGSEIPF